MHIHSYRYVCMYVWIYINKFIIFSCQENAITSANTFLLLIRYRYFAAAISASAGALAVISVCFIIFFHSSSFCIVKAIKLCVQFGLWFRHQHLPQQLEEEEKSAAATDAAAMKISASVSSVVRIYTPHKISRRRRKNNSKTRYRKNNITTTITTTTSSREQYNNNNNMNFYWLENKCNFL